MGGVFFRRRTVPMVGYDAATNRWSVTGDASPVDRDALTVTTFNVWYDGYFADERYRAIATLLSRETPDVMVFQEMTPPALEILQAQPWIREHYRCAAVVGGRAGNYGLVMFSRLPTARVIHSRLPSRPTRRSRGMLLAEFAVNGRPLAICSLHLDSGKGRARLRGRQLRRVFRALRSADDAIVLGDFNMRDSENTRITLPYYDVWPTLRPHHDGFTEDTSINTMRLDSKNKHTQVRFDRVLLKGPAWSADSIDLLGAEPISSAHPRVFPSDHFGVKCCLVRRRA
ncbi:MAG: tyrosyl-DNA phosphodiesterase 2 [Mycobacterium sp.]|jgi:tyrosyl-DNA phosphodiesterase 2|nr:tyrosyl-DNA phosphodiesterase 2 [Mycobacterium sp.]